MNAETESPDKNGEHTILGLKLSTDVNVKAENLRIRRVHLRGKYKIVMFTVWKENGEIIAMKTNGDIVLDQKMGGYLLDLSGDNVPHFDQFYVARCDGHDKPEDNTPVLLE